MKERLQNIFLAPLGWAFHALALMPWWWIYMNADCLYFFVYYIFRYRRKIVHKNLRECFPEKSDAERHDIETKFYHQLADYFFETVKLLHMKDDDIRQRMVFHNVELIDDALEQGQSVMMYGAHIGNWEWITSITLWFNEATKARGNVLGQAYHPLENQWFDRLFLKLRSRYSTCFPSHQILRVMISNKQQNRHMAIGLLSDQHPLPNHDGLVVKFLNHPTSMIIGSELIAAKLDMRVGYFYVRKISRGHYDCTLVPIAEHAKQESKGAITRRYAELLEENIRECPSYWLWTHNRWKRPVEYPKDTSE